MSHYHLLYKPVSIVPQKRNQKSHNLFELPFFPPAQVNFLWWINCLCVGRTRRRREPEDFYTFLRVSTQAFDGEPRFRSTNPAVWSTSGPCPAFVSTSLKLMLRSYEQSKEKQSKLVVRERKAVTKFHMFSVYKKKTKNCKGMELLSFSILMSL